MIKITDTVKHLIIINVLFFVATLAFKEKAYDLLAMHYFENPAFKPWQIVTHIFMHGNFDANNNITITHILFNMIGLWMFGSSVEQMIGTKRFLTLYFIAGIGAVLFSQGIDYVQYHQAYELLNSSNVPDIQIANFIEKGIPLENEKLNTVILTIVGKYNARLVGASGALYGVMVAFGVLLPKAKMGLMFLPIMIEARIFIPLVLLSDMYFGVFSVNTGIGHFAHIGGAIFGFIVIWYYKKQYENKRFR